MSSIAIKPGADGVKVVAVDQGSIAQRMGIAPDDTLQEVNGQKLSSAGDMNQVYEALKNATNFEVKVLRNGRSETLRYEIR
jgi:S1-C subfamily serine protease